MGEFCDLKGRILINKLIKADGWPAESLGAFSGVEASRSVLMSTSRVPHSVLARVNAHLRGLPFGITQRQVDWLTPDRVLHSLLLSITMTTLLLVCSGFSYRF